MRKTVLILGVILLALFAFFLFPKSIEKFQHPLIEIDQPKANAFITSPLEITGKARGNWYFEADFPIRLLDEEGNEIAFAIAPAQGEWMTTEFVPFKATLEFETKAENGFLVFQKNNPSDLRENDDEFRIPVRF